MLETKTIRCEETVKKENALPVIIVAGGSSTRMKGKNKLFAEILGIPVIVRTLLEFENSEYISRIILVARNCDMLKMQMLAEKYMITKLTDLTEGGGNRHSSVLNGMKRLNENEKCVLISDGARPFVKPEMIKDCAVAMSAHKGCLCAVKSKDTVFKAKDGFIDESIDRETVYLAQTPQGVDVSLYLKSSEENKDKEFTDDASVITVAGENVKIVKGSYENIKITTMEDLILAEAIVREEQKCE